jgi:hypothetical protein
MGVKAPAKKKTLVNRFAEDLKRARSQLAELGYGDDDFIATDDDEDESSADERRGKESSKKKKKNHQKKKASAPKAKGRYVLTPESDDDEVVPPKVEKLWATQAAKEALEASTGWKRKQGADASGLAEVDGDESPVRPQNRRTQREAERVAGRAKRPKRAHVYCDSEEEEEAEEEEAEEEAPPSTSNKNRKGPPFVPLPKTPLPKPEWATPPKKRSTVFTLPTSSQKIDEILNTNTPTAAASAQPARNKKQQSSAHFDTKDPSTPEKSTPSKPAYDESEPFEFKLIVSHADQPGQEMEVYLSSDLKDCMKAFWPLQRKQLEQWEDAAGTNWAWELQKTQKSRGHKDGKRRFCVSSKVAKRPTLWRRGDNGNYACRKCASNASLCFTWVSDEEAEADDDEDAGIPMPKGEFWCLPVHPSDRRCEVTEGREIRTWLNEGDNSESDSSGDGDGVESDADEYKVESDFDPLVSESSTSEEENQEESDFDGGC